MKVSGEDLGRGMMLMDTIKKRYTIHRQENRASQSFYWKMYIFYFYRQ